MSQEIDKVGQPMPQQPLDQTAQQDNGGMCVLSMIINAVGVLVIIAGIVLAALAADGYSTQDYVPFCVIGGILLGIFNFAFAVIVDACQKYRDAHNG